MLLVVIGCPPLRFGQHFPGQHVFATVRDRRIFTTGVLMRGGSAVFAVFLATVLLTAGCGRNSGPTTPAASIGTPSPALPADGSQIANLAQPVALIVQNATATAAGVTYTFEVATDSAFLSKVQVISTVAEGAGGQTSVKLDTLFAARTYFWHAQAIAGAAAGAFGPTFTFTIGAVIAVGAPAPVSPLSGAVTNERPQLTIANAVRVGAAGAITYRFDVADNAGFASVLFTATVAEGPGVTSVTTTSLPMGRTLFWRATSLDSTNGLSSASSAIQSFTVATPSAAELIAQRQGVTLWPGTKPSGTPGGASMAAGWGIATLTDFRGNRFSSPPLEVLRVFDLLDRGFDPDGAIGWLRTNAYPTSAVWYASVAAIGFPEQYMARIGRSWELVLRVGA